MGNSLSLSYCLYCDIVVVSFWPFTAWVLVFEQSNRNHFVINDTSLSVQQMFCKYQILGDSCSVNL